MLVPLHFFRLGYSPFALAFLFLLYEAAGAGANLVGGWLTTRFGISRMLAAGLALFGLVFAAKSSVHSYLILAYADSERAAEDVGFYHAANAAGRFAGTLLSVLLTAWGGLVACLVASALMLAGCWAVTLALPLARAR